MQASVKTCLISLILSLWTVSGEKQQFHGYQVWRVTPETEAELNTLRTLQDELYHQLDFWRDPTAVLSPVDIMVGPETGRTLHQLLTDNNLNYHIMINDVPSLAEKTYRRPDTPTSMEEVDTDRYYTLQEIHDFIYAQDLEFGEDTEVINIGESYEGRDLLVLKISRPGEDRRAIWIDAGIHAREWIAPATANYFISRLLHDYESDPDVTRIRDSFDWYIHPVVNPDGYQYTWDENRMWRKTRSHTDGSLCLGADGNRNFDYMWDESGGSSTNPCSDLYRGQSAASEVEVRALQEFILSMRESFNLSVTLHNFGQIFLLPWGYTTTPPDDFDELAAVACVARDVTEEVNGEVYTCQRPNGIMTGNTMDWAKGRAGIKYSFLLELRDRGAYGFLLPPDLIFDAAHEVWEGMKAMAISLIDEQNN